MRHRLVFLPEHQLTFQLIQSGEKCIETRAGNDEYLKIRSGDVLELVCGEEACERRVKIVRYFSTLDELLAMYQPEVIHPGITSRDELRELYFSFPGYPGRLKKFGVLVFEFSN